jgi:hypothetical protein
MKKTKKYKITHTLGSIAYLIITDRSFLISSYPLRKGYDGDDDSHFYYLY